MKFAIFSIYIWLLLMIGAFIYGDEKQMNQKIPAPVREFRAAWVATVGNVDWPSKPGLPISEQRREAMAILDRMEEMNMNAVILQVRPQADAVYKSDLEPSSYFLTGEQGLPLGARWDPLKFWIYHAHNRGIQLHAWFNPYRANTGKGTIHETSIVKTRPDLVVKLKNGYWWMDPSQADAKDHTIRVIMDVVKRYNIDGVHFDDYFYPYPAYNGNQDFPDTENYQAYQERGGNRSRGDWRRGHVNDLVERLYRDIKKEKQHVEFGISPFGIWRPGYPEGVTGLDQYDTIYADAKLWFNKGWIDYFTPQLYWPMASEKQSFPALLGWWHKQNYNDRHLWPGLHFGKANGVNETEIIDQLMCSRELCKKGNHGACLFSMKGLMTDELPGVKALREGPWSTKAVIPASPWIDKAGPNHPTVKLTRERDGQLFVTMGLKGGDKENDLFQFVINKKRKSKWLAAEIVPGKQRRYKIGRRVEAVAVRAVDRTRNISEVVILEVSDEKGL